MQSRISRTKILKNNASKIVLTGSKIIITILTVLYTHTKTTLLISSASNAQLNNKTSQQSGRYLQHTCHRHCVRPDVPSHHGGCNPCASLFRDH